jgi:hypothetical protein
MKYYLFAFTILIFSTFTIKKSANSKPSSSISLTNPNVDSKRIKEALLFSRKQKLDTTLAFFIDMSIHSGKKRFFIVDLHSKKTLFSGLCCHGLGNGSTEATPVFSNVEGSNCTSLGKYKTGIRSYSTWGIHVHYKMHGLEKTNNNSFKRIVVLHSYDQMPEKEIYPTYLPMGWSLGCPVIANNLMTSIDSLLKKRKRSVLLWIYK